MATSSPPSLLPLSVSVFYFCDPLSLCFSSYQALMAIVANDVLSPWLIVCLGCPAHVSLLLRHTSSFRWPTRCLHSGPYLSHSWLLLATWPHCKKLIILLTGRVCAHMFTHACAHMYEYATVSIWRSEDSFYHVDSGDGSKALGLDSKCQSLSLNRLASPNHLTNFIIHKMWLSCPL